jgi:hypothetical protein
MAGVRTEPSFTLFRMPRPSFASDDEAFFLTSTQEKNDRLCEATIYLANSMAEANLYKHPRKGAARKSFLRGFPDGW